MPEARYVRPLSAAEQKALRELYRRTDKADVRTRCQMILLSAQEHPVSEIAELTLFPGLSAMTGNEDSVLYWLDRYESQGLSGLPALAARPGEDRPGPACTLPHLWLHRRWNQARVGVVPHLPWVQVPGKVSGPCEADLKKLVDEEPRRAGYNFSTWTCADLVRELAKKGFEKVSKETIRVHFHTLGYRVLRPVRSITSPDPDYSHKVKELEKHKKHAKNGEILLYFEDEIDLNLLPGILRCWTLRGSQRKVMTPGSNVKRYGFGAVNYVSGKTLYRIADHKNSESFCAFVEQFIQTVTQSPEYHGQKIVLVVDNFIIHHSQKTSKFLEQYADQLELFALPTYSPWLNLIELLWKHLRRKVTHNHLFETITQLVEAVCLFLKSLNRTPKLTLQIIGATE